MEEGVEGSVVRDEGKEEPGASVDLRKNLVSCE